MTLLLAPVALGLAAPAPQQHGCCKNPVEMAVPQAPEQCCVISSKPEPVPVATVQARTSPGEQQVFVAVSRVPVPLDESSEYLVVADFAPSPPIGPNCNSILRI